MDETQKLAMTNLYKEIKHNIETTNPQDRASISKLDEIRVKSKTYNEFLGYIVDDLDPTYHANINLKPLETPSQTDQKKNIRLTDPSLKANEHKNNEYFSQSTGEMQESGFVPRPKVVQPQNTNLQEYPGKKVLPPKSLNASPFIKQPEINFGSKNSSFNKSIPQGAQALMGAVMKNNQSFSKLSSDMPPPQNVQKLSKESKILEKCGINESEERQLIENSSTKKLSIGYGSSQNIALMSSEKNILNETIIKSKFERKMNEYGMKNLTQGCMEMLNIGFNLFIKNFLTNLEKIAGIEKNSDSLSGFMKNSDNIPPPMRILENQDFKKILLTRKFRPEHFTNIGFSLISAPNKGQTLKQYESLDKELQTSLEEKIRSRKLFEIYEEKPQKKVKRPADDSKDIYDILLKNKNEKAKESDNQRKLAEDTRNTVSIFLERTSTTKSKSENKETQLKQTTKEVSRTNENKKTTVEKLKISLKTLIYVLENDPTYRKMPILLKAYMKQN